MAKIRRARRHITVAAAQRRGDGAAGVQTGCDPVRHGTGVERPVLVGVAALRWAAWVWLTVVALANLHRVHHRALALLVAATGAITAVKYLALHGGRWPRAMRPALVIVEVGVAAAVVLVDGWVGQARTTGQSLAGTWPLAAILVAGLVAGPSAGAGTGALLGTPEQSPLPDRPRVRGEERSCRRVDQPVVDCDRGGLRRDGARAAPHPAPTGGG